MKKATLLILNLLCMSIMQAQIAKIEKSTKVEIGKIAPMGSLHIMCEKDDNRYIFTFSDIIYTQITVFKSFAFEDVDNAFENLYTMIMNGLTNKSEEDIKLELPDGVLTLRFSKMMGVGSVQFYYYADGVGASSIYLTKKKVQQLFGKK